MAHPNVEMLRKAYDAFDRGDMDTLRTMFAEDAMVHVPGRSPIAGDYKGIDEIFGFFGKLFDLTGGTFKTEPHAFLADDEHGTVMGFDSGEREGKRLERSRTVELFHFRDGKIVEVWTLPEDTYASDEFWS